MYLIPDEHLWQALKASLLPIKRVVKLDPPKRLRVVRSAVPPFRSVLDLHGQTVQEAFDKTIRFLQRARRQGLKEVTVITGRGTTGKALIKNEFEGWLNHPHLKNHIRTYTWQSKGGAVKISLKKKSP